MCHGIHEIHGNMCCGRNYLTKAEKIETLEKYKKWLENEKKGVEETIEELEKAS